MYECRGLSLALIDMFIQVPHQGSLPCPALASRCISYAISDP
jgi:hypothetical protein